MLKNDPNIVNITLYLFDTCNLSCDFCYLNHTKLSSKDEILKKVEKYKEILKNRQENNIFFKFLGGEILADFILDDYFELYKEIIIDLNNYCKNLNKFIVFDITTNLIHKNTNRVLDLFKYLKENVNLEVDTSFDFTSRFKNKENLDTFISNCYLYKDFINVVNTVITSHLYRILVLNDITSSQEKDEIKAFNRLYNDKFPIMIAEYNNGNEKTDNNPLMIKSVNEFISLHKFLIDNYPMILQDFLSDNYKSSCPNRVTIINDQILQDCAFCSFGQLCGHNSLKKYVGKYNCVTCSYYNKCSLYCDYFSNTFNQQDKCWKKEIYDYIEDKYGTAI